jgi:16S rRNA (cytosine1407-C5)-methyltransferase
MLLVSTLFADGGKLSWSLDITAAPGSPNTKIAALMNNQGGSVASEYSSSRVKVLHANLRLLCGEKRRSNPF